jgi:hypothetical protein
MYSVQVHDTNGILPIYGRTDTMFIKHLGDGLHSITFTHKSITYVGRIYKSLLTESTMHDTYSLPKSVEVIKDSLVIKYPKEILVLTAVQDIQHELTALQEELAVINYRRWSYLSLIKHSGNGKYGLLYNDVEPCECDIITRDDDGIAYVGDTYIATSSYIYCNPGTVCAARVLDYVYGKLPATVCILHPAFMDCRLVLCNSYTLCDVGDEVARLYIKINIKLCREDSIRLTGSKRRNTGLIRVAGKYYTTEF